MTVKIEDSKKANTFGIVPSSIDEAWRLAEIIANSNFAPKDYKGKPHDVFLAIQMGAEVGLKPMQAVQNISIINGRPCIWGDALLAIVKSHDEFEFIKEDISNEIATCIVKRKNQPEAKYTFSMEQAKIAQLLGKDNWKKYPKRMLQLRARAFCCRDTFPDALKGLDSAELVSDYDRQEKDITPKPKSERLNTLIDSIDSPDSEEKLVLSPEETIEKLQLSSDKNELVSLLPNLQDLPEEHKVIAREKFKEKMQSFADDENLGI